MLLFQRCVTSFLSLGIIAPTPQSFVYRVGPMLTTGGKIPFQFVSMNVPNIWDIEDVPGRQGERFPATLFEQEDAIQSILGLGGRVFRSYTIGIGPGLHVTGPRQYNEAAWRQVDAAVACANRYKIKIMIPFINNGKDPEKAYGTYAAFAALRGKPPSAFFTDRQVIDDFKHLIWYTVTRKNRYSGLRYKDDPAIFGWQLGNELGSWKDEVPPEDWILEIATLIKALDPKHLVIDGTLAGHNRSRWSVKALKSPKIDVFTNHYYWGRDDLTSGRIAGDADYIRSFNKSFIITEFGLSSIDVHEDILKLVLRKNIAGALIWSLRFHAEKGALFLFFLDYLSLNRRLLRS